MWTPLRWARMTSPSMRECKLTQSKWALWRLRARLCSMRECKLTQSKWARWKVKLVQPHLKTIQVTLTLTKSPSKSHATLSKATTWTWKPVDARSAGLMRSTASSKRHAKSAKGMNGLIMKSSSANNVQLTIIMIPSKEYASHAILEVDSSLILKFYSASCAQTASTTLPTSLNVSHAPATPTTIGNSEPASNAHMTPNISYRKPINARSVLMVIFTTISYTAASNAPQAINSLRIITFVQPSKKSLK